MMYEKMDSVLEQLDSGNARIIEIAEKDPRIAVAILLYRLIIVDGRIRIEETDLYRTILETYLKISEDELELFEKSVRKAAESDELAAPLMKIAENMPMVKRQEILKFMQDLSVSDREFHEFEVNLVTKTAKIFNVKL